MDATRDDEAHITCPYCGEPVVITLDPAGGGRQDYVEDCAICCQPWTVQVRYLDDGSASVQVDPGD